MKNADTPRTDKARLDILQTGRPARVKAEFAEELERENDELHIAVNVARDLIKTLQDDNIKLRAALERLRDCDFVVTPMDRMDAVRDIAREALKGVKP